MKRRLTLVLFGLATLICTTGDTLASGPANAPGFAPLDPAMGFLAQLHYDGGAYFAWWKLLCIALPFLIWVGIVDWANKDGIKVGENTGLKPEVWNPIFVSTMLVGFFCGISIPIFAAGLPVYLVLAFFPPIAFLLVRRSRLKADPELANRVGSIKSGRKYVPLQEALPQDEGIAMRFNPSGDDENDRQTNLIRARQTAGFNEFKQMLEIGLTSRADMILLDYTRDQVTRRMQVDGAWHPLDPLDRVMGDALLASIKFVANLNPGERRYKQEGYFGIATDSSKATIDVISQGVPTGERVQLKFRRKVNSELSLDQLGMWPEMSQSLKKYIDGAGLVVISAPPGGGLTSTWRAALLEADRITRDCIAIVDQLENETDVENIAIHRYNSAEGQSPVSIMRTLLLAQPDCIVVPTVANAKSLDALVVEANEQDRSILTRTQAKSAAEGLLKLCAASKDRKAFATAARAVTCQKLLRRLCDKCKVEVQVSPKLIQQLGGDPKQQQTVFNAFRKPPPEQLVDNKGQPIEFQPCATCAGLGYIGRIAAYEMIDVSNNIRQILLTNPKVDAIEKAARKNGKTPLTSQMYRLVLVGITSLDEVQRVAKT